MKLADLLNADFDDSVKLERDTNGHHRVLFSDKELLEVNSFLKRDMDATYDDWVPVWQRSVENTETYRTVKIPIPDGGGQSIYPAPIARIPADQIIASVYNSVMRPKPIFAIDAYLKAEYDIPGQPIPSPPQMPVPGMPPPPQQNLVSTEKQTSELVAHRMEQGYDFVVRERIQLGPKLLKGLKGAVSGSPYWWKVVADPQEHSAISAKAGGAVIDLNDKYEETKMRGDIVKWYLVPFTNAMYPIDAESIDSAPWFAERKPMRPDELLKRYASDGLFLIKDDAEASNLSASTVDLLDEFRARAKQSTEKKSPASPIQIVPNWLVWFYWDCKYQDPNEAAPQDGKKKWKIKRLSLLGDFHLASGKLMTCWLNEYEHQCRPFELVDQMDDGDCTVDRMRYHQTVFTFAMQSEIKSAFIANTPLYWHDPYNSDLVAFFLSHKVVNAGDHVPGIFNKDWGLTPAGEKHYSMESLLKLILSMSQLDSRENDFTMGGRPPGRTPAATTAQVYQHAEEVKTMFMARLSLKLSRLLRLDAETRRQYQPLGEILPMWDAEHKRTIELPFRFPVGDVLDNFRIALTASDQALSEEKDPQQIMMRKQMLMADGEFIAKVLAPIINLSQPLPETVVATFKQIMMRDQQMVRKMMGQMVTDEENYDLTPQIEALIAERTATLQKMSEAPPPPPAPPTPDIKISLSGQLPPLDVEAAASTAGIGGMNAQSAGGPPTASPAGQARQGPPPGPPSGVGGQSPVPPHPQPPPAPPSGAGPIAPVQ